MLLGSTRTQAGRHTVFLGHADQDTEQCKRLTTTERPWLDNGIAPNGQHHAFLLTRIISRFAQLVTSVAITVVKSTNVGYITQHSRIRRAVMKFLCLGVEQSEVVCVIAFRAASGPNARGGQRCELDDH